MDGIWQYALTLLCSALICGMLLQLTPEGTIRKLLRTVCGAVMLCALLLPLTNMEKPDFQRYFEEFSQSGEQVALTGAQMVETERITLIKAGLEAYLLDRAMELNCQVTADISLDNEGYPWAVCISGEVSRDQRQQLSDIISNDLGIPEENQQWTGENQKN